MTRVRVQWLKNHGVRVVTEGPAGRTERFVASGGSLTIAEAAVALGTYPVKVRRLIERGRLARRVVRGLGVRGVRVSDLRRLKGSVELDDQRGVRA
jgi:hypothetical protein